MQKKVIATVLGITVMGVILASTLYMYTKNTKDKEVSITTFEQCAAKYPVMESYPEQCRTPDGKHFVNNVTSQTITKTGDFTCLPHKQTGGMQTLECAFGLKADSGEYYGLSDPEMKYTTQLATGSQVTITGVFANNLDETTNKYDTVGTIEINSILTNE